ncbi:MAG: GNAT family N-acetyltransferase, partial [Burkholderiales bacterium]|nr:GNAT family N-acetyltransferase [Burkholderiales bacterium]
LWRPAASFNQPTGSVTGHPKGHAAAAPPTEAQLCAACVLYVKSHSYGEYVFDWAWADAYHRHGLAYYPKGVVAVPFTPVPGPRLLAVDADARLALCGALIRLSEQLGLSSLHLLFAQDADVAAAQSAGLMLRHTVQFHWENTAGWPDFDAFLASLNQEKRKKIKQERRKVREAGVQFHTLQGQAITNADWDFFYRCYERTYLEHGNAPYLSRAFFATLAATQPDNWLLCVATRPGEADQGRAPIACSLIAVNSIQTSDGCQKCIEYEPRVAYGRYWGALERVDSLHFEACYYQPIEWCLANGYTRFEGGAQGEHKMARALMPVQTTSAHWLAHPAFAEAIDRYLQREGEGMAHYMTDLAQRTPFKRPLPPSGA